MSSPLFGSRRRTSRISLKRRLCKDDAPQRQATGRRGAPVSLRERSLTRWPLAPAGRRAPTPRASRPLGDGGSGRGETGTRIKALAFCLAQSHVGVIAWSRMVNPDVGEYGEPEILVQLGTIPRVVRRTRRSGVISTPPVIVCWYALNSSAGGVMRILIATTARLN
jgi:hypothetical protein